MAGEIYLEHPEDQLPNKTYQGVTVHGPIRPHPPPVTQQGLALARLDREENCFVFIESDFFDVFD